MGIEIKITPEMKTKFAAETAEHLEMFEQMLLKLESGSFDQAAVNTAFRAVHSIKGNSDYIGVKDIRDLSNALEDLLDDIRRHSVDVTQATIPVLLEGLDRLREMNHRITHAEYRESDITGLLQKIIRLKSPSQTVVEQPGSKKVNVNLFDIFSKTATQHIEYLTQQADRVLGGHRSKKIRNNTLRILRTFFISANYAGIEPIAEILQALENRVRDAKTFGKTLAADLIGQLDIIKKMMGETKLRSTDDDATHRITQAVSAELTGMDLRLPPHRADRLMNRVTELLIAVNALNHSADRITTDRVNSRRLDSLNRGIKAVTQAAAGIHAATQSIRLVRMDTLFSRLPRIVRDLSLKFGKKIEIAMIGGNTEIDRTVIEQLADPMIHLIRNAVDHGIEVPEKRLRRNKPEIGTITVKASQENNQVVVDVIDDGNGIDRDDIRAAARRSGVIDAGKLEQMTPDETLNLVFRPGFTTADNRSDVSGRGVGLDIVSSNLKTVGGNVMLSSEKGRATRFRLQVPVSLSAVEVLLVMVHGDAYAIPLSCIVETVSIAPHTIQRINNAEMISHKQDLIALCSLSGMLGLSADLNTRSAPGKGERQMVVVNFGGALKGIVVDRVAELTASRSFCALPIRHDGQVRCVVSLHAPSKTFFDEDVVTLLEEIASDVSFGLDVMKEKGQRRQAEKALNEEKQRLEITLRSIGDAVLTTDADGRVVLMNRIAENLTGWNQADAAGQPLETVFRIINEVTRMPSDNPVQKIMETKGIIGLANHTLLVSRDGREIPIVDSGAPILSHNGQIIGVVLVFQDDTKRKAAQQAIAENERKYRSLVEYSSNHIFMLSPKGTFLASNDRMPLSIMPSHGSLVGYSLKEAFEPAVADFYRHKLEAVVARETPLHFEYKIKTSTGVRYHHDTLYPIFQDGGLWAVGGISRDISEQKESEFERNRVQQILELRDAIANILLTVPEEQSHNKVLQVILAATHSQYGILGYVDGNGDMVCPSMTRDVWQACQIADKNIVFPREKWCGIWGKAFQEKKPRYSNDPGSFTLPDGHISISNHLVVPLVHQGTLVGTIQLSNKPGGYREADLHLVQGLGSFIAPIMAARKERDQLLNERQRLQERIQQSQKMEAIGNLAGGIAHDFNNILTSVIGFTELALDEVEKGSLIEDNLHEVHSAGRRAKNLVQQILTFSRQDDQELKPVQVGLIVKEALKLLRPTLPTSIAIDPHIESTSLISADSTQIHQIIMNLCTNAASAMEENGGQLTISLRDTVISNTGNAILDHLPSGEYIKLVVSDTGMGIAHPYLDKIFEPYFTTKPEGEGTGLGLAVVHGIVKKLAGDILVDSKPRKGAAFTVYLPILKKRETIDYKHTQPVDLPGGTERILLVDDEPTILKMTRQRLEKFGYIVESRTSSIEALELFRKRADGFDLVITDMTMPNMTGDNLSKKLIKIRPGLPIILCTGYSKKISESRASEIGIRAFAMKPLDQSTLLRTVRKVLDEAH